MAGGRKGVRDVEIATGEYIDWFMHLRPHGEIGHFLPAEFETQHWARHGEAHYVETRVSVEVGSKESSLPETRDDSSVDLNTIPQLGITALLFHG